MWRVRLCYAHALIEPEKRVSEFYESYLDEYGGSESAAPGPTSTPTLPARAVSDRSRRQRESTMSRNSGLRSAPVGGSIRRKGTAKRFTRGSSRSYEDEEEGYGSGDYEEFSLDTMQKIRVKVRQHESIFLTFDSLSTRFITRTRFVEWPY